MATDPTIAANQAQTQQIYEDMMEYAKQQAEVDYARTQGAFVAGEGLRAAGNAGVAAINYLGDWNEIVNKKEENNFAASHGLDNPNAYFPDLGSYASSPSDDNWNAMDEALDQMNSNKDDLGI
jgi:hypothetical protein